MIVGSKSALIFALPHSVLVLFIYIYLWVSLFMVLIDYVISFHYHCFLPLFLQLKLVRYVVPLLMIGFLYYKVCLFFSSFFGYIIFISPLAVSLLSQGQFYANKEQMLREKEVEVKANFVKIEDLNNCLPFCLLLQLGKCEWLSHTLVHSVQ